MILKLLGVLLGFFVLANIVFIDYLVFVKKTPFAQTKIASIEVEPATASKTNDNFCSNACLTAIAHATESKSNTPVKEVTPTKVAQQVQTNTGTKEFYVPLGSGISTSEDWMDIAGASAYIDSSNYPAIKKITFEATLFTPTGNQTAYARLYNVTDKHPVWFSEVSLDGGNTELLSSQPIGLDSGNKLYQVQMKTSLKFQSNLNQSRVHIITQ